jgi:Pyruvate/2-oxoacid:ferredoxin oxidoreductase delta subunit
MNNKSRIAKGVKIIALVIYGMLTIATCAGVWNFCPERAVKLFSAALFAANGGVIWYLAKTIKTDEQ